MNQALALPAAFESAARCVELARWCAKSVSSPPPKAGHADRPTPPFAGSNAADGPHYVAWQGDVTALETSQIPAMFNPGLCGVTIAQRSDLQGLPAAVASVTGELARFPVLWWQQVSPRHGAHPRGQFERQQDLDHPSGSWRFLVPMVDEVRIRPSVVWHVIDAPDGSPAPWLAECDVAGQLRAMRAAVLDHEKPAVKVFEHAAAASNVENFAWRMSAPLPPQLAGEPGLGLFLAAARLVAASAAPADGVSRNGVSAHALAVRESFFAVNSDLLRTSRRLLTAAFTLLARTQSSRALRMEPAVDVHDLA